MDSASRIEVAKRYLRRKYADNSAGLKTLADAVAGKACKYVTLTGNSYEGGGASGQITFEPLEYLAAIEEIIAELDPDTPQPAAAVVRSDFSCRQVQT